MYIIVVGVMKTGNIVPTVEMQPTSLTFRASMLPLQHIGSMMSYTHAYLSVWLLASMDSADTLVTLEL